MTKMFQCELVKDNRREVAWIDERGAFVGAVVSVPELGGYWKIVAVYTPGLQKEALTELRIQKRRGFNSIDRS